MSVKRKEYCEADPDTIRCEVSGPVQTPELLAISSKVVVGGEEKKKKTTFCCLYYKNLSRIKLFLL